MEGRQSGAVAGGRGAHRLFLGYAVGVGKTYQMLAEGHRRSRAGEDVVIGLLEPHGRADTIALAAGLQRLECVRANYHGVQMEELDADSALARRPDWLLVDELAHTMPPGGEFDKRWQAVEALLGAGISIMSTMNVQHLAGLNDFVYQVTGVRVAETVPDRVIDEADDLVLVDMEPEALIARLKRGRVFGQDALGPALTHFFGASALRALREAAGEVAHRHDEAKSARP